MTEYTVTGIHFQMPGKTTQEKKDATEKYLQGIAPGTEVVLVAEPNNPVDTNAIAAYIDYRFTGYITKEQTAEVHPMLDADGECKAVADHNDGHITLYITIPPKEHRPRPQDLVCDFSTRPRQLPPSPLGEDVYMPFTRAENTLQVVARHLSRIEVKKENLTDIIMLGEHYVPLLRLSICHEDNQWVFHIKRKLEDVCKLCGEWGASKEEEESLARIYNNVKDCLRDLHRTSEHWPERIFTQHLKTIGEDEEITRWLYTKYANAFLDGKSFAEADRQTIVKEHERLLQWLKALPWSELKTPENLQAMGQKVNYIGLSRKELYELFAVLLLLEQLDATTRLEGILASEKAMVYWKRLQQAGFVGKDCKPLPTTTRQQTMYIADVFAEKMGLIKKWKPFEDFWGIKHLAQEVTQFQLIGKVNRQKEIDKIFKE